MVRSLVARVQATRRRTIFAAACVVLFASGFVYLRYGAGMIRGVSACMLEMDSEWRISERSIVMNVSNRSTLPMFAVSRIIPSDSSLTGSPELLTPVNIVKAQETVAMQNSAIVPGSHSIRGFVTGCTFADPARGIEDYVYALPLKTDQPSIAQPRDGTPHPTHAGTLLYAVDFATPEATIVLAARDGTVAFVFDESGWSCLPFQSLTGPCTRYSNFIVIEHSDGTQATYAHLLRHSASVSVGQTVRRGDPIAKSGRTGTRGPHLHFAIHTLDTSTGDDRTVPFRLAFGGRRYSNSSSLMIETQAQALQISAEK